MKKRTVYLAQDYDAKHKRHMAMTCSEELAEHLITTKVASGYADLNPQPKPRYEAAGKCPECGSENTIKRPLYRAQRWEAMEEHPITGQRVNVVKVAQGNTAGIEEICRACGHRETPTFGSGNKGPPIPQPRTQAEEVAEDRAAIAEQLHGVTGDDG